MSRKTPRPLPVLNTICRSCLQYRKVVDGTALKTLRIAFGLSLRETARRVGISAAYLCDIEKKKRLPPMKLTNFWRWFE